jgi:hypothetical protein
MDYWATTWSESVYQFDTNGALLSVFPYSGPAIGGLALEPDATIPPKLWAWRAEGPAQGPMCTAVRLDSPAVQFLGVEMNGDPAANDMPGGVDIVRWGDKLTLLALQQSNYLPGDGHDFLVGYSLGKEWREWLIIETDTGTVPPNSQENITLTFYGIPGVSGERERSAVINFFTNDPLNPVISWNILLTVTSSTRIVGSDNSLQKTFELYQNYPNPFNSGTTIPFFLPVESDIILNIYTMTGQRIRTISLKQQSAGNQCVRWDGKDDKSRDVSSGLYLYQIITRNQVLTNKMLLLK